MSGWKGLEGDDLIQNLRHLLINFDPHIREAGSSDQVEEALVHMEENDENFHRYEFVRQLKRKIEEVLGPIIEDEIEKQSTSTGSVDIGQDTLVSRITERVIHSRHYNDLSRKMKKNILEAVDHLMRNFDSEFGTGRHRDSADQLQASKQTRKTYIVSDEDESSCGSSFNQGMMWYTSHEMLENVAEKLGKTKDTQTRIEGMQTLNQNSPGDFVNSDQWTRIRKNLMDVMADPDEQLSYLSQKFIVRAFTTTSQYTKEVYTLLADYLIVQFNSRRGFIPKIKNGLDVQKGEIVKLIKAFRLLNEFQQETINYWIRYPDKYLEMVLESTLNLFSIHQQGAPVGTSSSLTPLHFVSLIDPKAQWFIKWMHGNYSRMKLLKLLEKYKSVVVNAVHHCLEFSANRKTPFDLMSEMSDNFSKTSVTGENKGRSYYTGAELEYSYFIHSVFLLGRLLCFINGRKLFPIKLKDSEEPVTITKLLVALVLIVVDPSLNNGNSKSTPARYEPGSLVTEILKNLCSSEQVCEICLYKDDITNTLLSPVSQYLDTSHIRPGSEYSFNEDHHIGNETTLLHVADIVSMIASSTKGRRHLIYGEKKDIFTRTKSSAAHIIAKFTRKALLGELPHEAGPAPSKAVIGAYLYICRQLYNTCEGLLVLYPYDLHSVGAIAWREANRDADNAVTPTPSDNSSDTDVTTRQGKADTQVWEDTLRDNLLNFASTAKGILLLQQTGAINECMSYMYIRYEQKLQVSKCEKFGYGYMVTQVAGTAPGMVALQKTGYIKALIAELWSVMESGLSDAPLYSAKTWPVDAVDRHAHKHLVRLLNVLASFPAVYEVLARKPLPTQDEYTFREMPETIAGFIDRLILVDSPGKTHSLFNYEHSHVFGLRVLSVMISCRDTFLLLQSQYRFQDVLLKAQGENHPNDREDLIVDMLSVERNYVLVKSYLIGGPSERVHPPRILGEDSVYPYPLFSSFPVPREYTPTIGGRTTLKQAFVESEEEENDLTKFLSNTKTFKADRGKTTWLERCKNTLTKMIIAKSDQVKGMVIQQLLETCIPQMTKVPEECVFPLLDYTGTDSAVKAYHLSPLQTLGIKIAIRYGIHLKLIHTSSDVTEKLTHLIKQCACFLQQQQKSADTNIKFLQGNYPGFDWFAATVFLIFNGNIEKSWQFLYKFSTLGCSGYLWTPRLHSSVHLPSALMSSGISPLFSSTGHNIELILQIELPLVASAFRMSGYTPAQICVHWLKQCFWDYLDWQDICHYVCVCIVMGIDYQVYMCVAILRHMQKRIMEHMQTHDLIIFLKETALDGFHVSSNLRFMNELEKRYRKIVLSDMLNISKP
ncbi:protein broad-minded-like [Ylistrum balloti]|uniref:protein broad-minded-like n=1 Tax=Ylistrum balloti TaxID=509963 RepID=UPI002905F358|nr:protein broad-minded-like [Ylistrum balloti]